MHVHAMLGVLAIDGKRRSLIRSRPRSLRTIDVPDSKSKGPRESGSFAIGLAYLLSQGGVYPDAVREPGQGDMHFCKKTGIYYYVEMENNQ